MSLEDILKNIQTELVKKDQLRQEIHSSMRKVIRLSKQAIFLVHKTKFEEAKKTLTEAEKIFAAQKKLAKNDPELFCMGDVDAAFQEYAEAHSFLSMVEEGHFVNPAEINVPTVSFVLGLADVVGELRRRALDFIRKGDSETAEECLELMEAMYMELINLDEIQYLAPGLRRKCDVARRVIEATRGDITTEVRRNMLENSITELKKTLEKKNKKK